MIVVMHHTDAKLTAACYYAADIVLSEQANGAYHVLSNKHGPSGIVLPAKLPLQALQKNYLARLIERAAEIQKGIP